MSQAEPTSPLAAAKGAVILIGMMGSGKTTVGTRLATALGCPFTDLDALIEIQDDRNRSVGDIIEEDGLLRFREKEHEALCSWFDQGTLGVLATGGGVIVTPQNRALLRATLHPVVWLQADLESLTRRTAGAQQDQRPLLHRASPEERFDKLKTILNERHSWYLETSSSLVDCQNKSPDEIAREIADQSLRGGKP